MRYLCICILLAAAVAPARTSAAEQGGPAAAAATCGNKLLEAGETCAQCPADCTVQPCRPGKSSAVFAVQFSPPPAPDVSTALLRVGYRSDLINLPGSGDSVRRHLKPATKSGMLVPNDLDYALRIVVSGTTAIPAGQLLTIEFERCAGAPAPTAADLSCQVEACASAEGAVDTCRCQITERTRR